MAKVIMAAAIIITTAMMLTAQTKTVVLQQGLDDYTGCKDKELRNPDRNYGDGPVEPILDLIEKCPNCSFTRVAIQFDLSSIPKNEEITSATLKLFVGVFDVGTTGDYAIHRITRNWVENEADWDNASKDTPWNNRGGDYVSEKIDEITVDRAGDRWVSFNVLETVKDFIVNPNQNFGFLLKNTALTLKLRMGSSEHDTIKWRPKMIIEHTTPEAAVNQKQGQRNCMHSPVKLSAINQTLHVANSSDRPVWMTLTRLDGTTVVSEKLSGSGHKSLSVHSAGVYLISVFGNTFTMHEKVSLYH